MANGFPLVGSAEDKTCPEPPAVSKPCDANPCDNDAVCNNNAGAAVSYDRDCSIKDALGCTFTVEECFDDSGGGSSAPYWGFIVSPQSTGKPRNFIGSGADSAALFSSLAECRHSRAKHSCHVNGPTDVACNYGNFHCECMGNWEGETCSSSIGSGSGERKARGVTEADDAGFSALESDEDGAKMSHGRLPLHPPVAVLSADTAKLIQQDKRRRDSTKAERETAEPVAAPTPDLLPVCPAFLALPAETAFEWGSSKQGRRTRREQKPRQHDRRRRNHVKDAGRWAPGCTFPVNLTVLFDLSEEERAGSTVSFTSIAGYDDASDFAWIVTDSTDPINTDWYGTVVNTVSPTGFTVNTRGP